MQTEELVNGNKNKLKLLAVFALVFVLGFASGYYYLDGNKDGKVLTIKDNSAACSELFKKDAQADSSQNLAKESKTSDFPADSAAGAVLATNTQNNTAKAVSGPQTAIKAFASSKNSTLYHTRDCQYVKRIKAENVVWFSSQKEAEAAGRKPHSCVSK